MSEEKKNTKKWTKKTTIKAIVTFVIIAILIIAVFILVNRNDADAQLNRLKDSINNDDPKTLANLLSTGNRTMKKQEAENLIEYFNKQDNKQRLNRDLNNVERNLKSDEALPDLGSVKDKNNQSIIDFSKNGKQYIFLDKVAMKPHYRNVYIKELDNAAVYNFDDKHQVAVDKNKTNKLGSFIVGDYDVPVKKEFPEGAVKGEVSGRIHINTDDIDEDKRVIAKQDFNQTQIQVKLHNDEKLEEGSKKLYINDDVKSLKENKLYGYFPNDNSFSVKAEGEIDGQRFKTKSVDVLQGTTNNSIQTVNLYFNDKEIKKKIKENDKNKKALTKFIKEYNKDLNKAYKKKAYDEISSYIKEDSEAEKFMKPKFKSKASVKYKDVKVEKITRDADDYKISVSKKYRDYNVNNIYHIKIENDNPKITRIEDA